MKNETENKPQSLAMAALKIALAIAVFCSLTGGLSNHIAGRPAPVSAVFLCPFTGIPNFGVAVGYTTPAQAGKTDAGTQYDLREPRSRVGIILSNNIAMKTEIAAVTRCNFALPWWAYERIVGGSRHGLIGKIVTVSVVNQTLTPDWQAEGFALAVPVAEAREPANDMYFCVIPAPLMAAFDKLAKAHGMSRKAALSFTLKWGAMHMPRKVGEK